MKKGKFLYTIALMCTAALMGSCTQEAVEPTYVYQDGVEVRIARTSSQDAENVLTDLDGYLFAPDGKLTASYPDIQVVDGVCRLDLSYTDGSRLMLLANGQGLSQPAESVTTIDELKASVYAYRKEEGMPHLFMTGELAMTAGMKKASVSLVRGLARIDLKLHGSAMKVSGVRIGGLADRMYVWQGNAVTAPTDVETYVVEPEKVFTSSEEGIAYVLEQNGDAGAHTITLNVEEGGDTYSLEGTLPKLLERNKVYVVNVYGMGQSGKIEVDTEVWDDGEDSEASESQTPWVDVAHSNMGENIAYDAQQNEVRVRFTGTEGATATLKLNVEDGVKPVLAGLSDEVTLQGDVLSVCSKKRVIGAKQEVLYVNMVDMHNEQLVRGTLKVILESHPVKMKGKLAFNSAGECDFNTYADGELAQIVLPEGWTARVEIEEGEDPWMKLDMETVAGTCRVLGGWKPNDPKADGRPQKARIVFTDAATAFTDTYTVQRLNWTLPVVNVNGVWWCKYNLRGNVKNFADQVSLKEDQEIRKQGDFATYLSNCSSEQFLRLAGDQYLGGKPDGLKPANDENGKLYFVGYDPAGASNFGSIPATQMAPDGFEVPGYDYFRFFTWGGNSNMGHNSNGVFNNGMSGTWAARLKYNSNIFRTINTDDLKYGNIGIYKFWKENNASEELVFFGLGHQWQRGAGNVSPMYLLFATSGTGGSSWGIEGYAPTNKKENWYKYTGHNSGKTRMIRCIKTPVEYIYE